MKPHPLHPLGVVGSAWHHRELLAQLIRRDILARYRGSVGGVFWSFLQPLIMLAIYTLVLGHFLKARWPGTENSLEYSLVLFAGLILFNFLADCINRAPQLVLSNPNYVKKVVFPLEILPWMAVGSAMFHTLLSLVAWVIFYVAVHGSLHWTVALVPLLLVPLGLIGLGLCWFLGSAAVYVRDLVQTVTPAVQALMFLSPLFYSIDSVPAGFKTVLMLNPLSFVIDEARSLMIAGQPPGWGLAAYAAASAVVAWLGFAWFQKTRDGFADVL